MLFIRRLIKITVAGLLYYSGLLQIIARRRSQSEPDEKYKILTYHRVLENSRKKQADTQPGMCVTEMSFAKQMQFIATHYDPIEIDLLSRGLDDETILPKRPIVVTFDDGWIDNYTVAFPLLKNLNLPAMIYLPTDLINSDRLPSFIHVSLLIGESDIWPEKAVAAFKEVVAEGKLDQTDPALAQHKLDATGTDAFNFMVTLMHLSLADMDRVIKRLLELGGIDEATWFNQRWLINWDEIREMNRSVISFGSHGQSHDLMTEIPLEQVESELAESRRVIEMELGEVIQHFSYPNGNYNEAVKKLVQAAGFSSAVTQTGCLPDEKLPERFALRRINMNEGSTLGPLGRFSKAMFACRIEGLL